MIFIDTSIFVDVLRSNGPRSSFILLKKIEDEENMEAFTSAITVAELSVGAYRSDRKNAVDKTFDLLSLANIVDMNENIAREGGKIYSELISKGKQIELNDCLIAASSLSLNINEIITRDIEHFDRIADLKAITPEEQLKYDI